MQMRSKGRWLRNGLATPGSACASSCPDALPVVHSFASRTWLGWYAGVVATDRIEECWHFAEAFRPRLNPGRDGNVVSDFLSISHTDRFAPRPEDSIAELLGKAEEMLEWMWDNQNLLRSLPLGVFEEKLALWKPLTVLLQRALADPALAEDAHLEMHRVWAVESHQTALYVVTMSVYARSDAARWRFVDDPETLHEMVARLDQARPRALRLLTREERETLREKGFLQPGE